MYGPVKTACCMAHGSMGLQPCAQKSWLVVALFGIIPIEKREACLMVSYPGRWPVQPPNPTR